MAEESEGRSLDTESTTPYLRARWRVPDPVGRAGSAVGKERTEGQSWRHLSVSGTV